MKNYPQIRKEGSKYLQVLERWLINITKKQFVYVQDAIYSGNSIHDCNGGVQRV